MNKWKELSKLGVILYCLGCFRVFKDGDGITAVYRWYHPINWVIFLILIFFFGIPGAIEELPFKITGYYANHKDEIKWL